MPLPLESQSDHIDILFEIEQFVIVRRNVDDTLHLFELSALALRRSDGGKPFQLDYATTSKQASLWTRYLPSSTVKVDYIVCRLFACCRTASDCHSLGLKLTGALSNMSNG